MKLKEKEKQLFQKWAIQYFANEKKLSSKDIFERLQKDLPSLIKGIKKVSKKSGVVAYIGRCLLPEFRREGWLDYKKGYWSVKIVPGRCAQCFKLIDDVYYIDSDDRHFCCEDCCEEFYEFYDLGEDYNPYWDEYSMMYIEFIDMYPKIESYKIVNATDIDIDPLEHIKLINFIKDIEEIIYDSEYEEIVDDEGGDGAFAAEVYRMYCILKNGLEELIDIEGKVREKRPEEIELYSIVIDYDYLVNEGKKNKSLQKFIKKNTKFLMENRSNIWITSEFEKRSKWYDEFKKRMDGYISYKNYYQCPNCGAISEYNRTWRAIDDYHYCEKCYEDVKCSGGFNRRDDY
ncbi:hypothetical protein [Clostridium sp. DL1XJH146]